MSIDTLKIEMTHISRHATLRWQFRRKCGCQLTFMICFKNCHVTLWIWSWTSNEMCQTWTPGSCRFCQLWFYWEMCWIGRSVKRKTLPFLCTSRNTMHYARHRQVGEVYTHGMFALKPWLESLILLTLTFLECIVVLLDLLSNVMYLFLDESIEKSMEVSPKCYGGQ
jgi:hypothetical protein